MEHGVENKIFAKILARLGNINQQQYMFAEAIKWYRKSIKFNDLDQKPKKNLNLCQTKLRNERRKALWVSVSYFYYSNHSGSWYFQF